MSPMSMGTTDLTAGPGRRAAAPRIDLELNAESIAALPPSLTGFLCAPGQGGPHGSCLQMQLIYSKQLYFESKSFRVTLATCPG